MANKYIDVSETIIDKNKLTIPLSSVGLNGNTSYEVNIPSGTIKYSLNNLSPSTTNIKLTTGEKPVPPCVFSTSALYTSSPGYTTSISSPYIKYVTDPVCIVTNSPHFVNTNVVHFEFYMSEQLREGLTPDIPVYEVTSDESVLTNFYAGGFLTGTNNDIFNIEIPVDRLTSGKQYYIYVGCTATGSYYSWMPVLKTPSSIAVSDVTALQAVFKDYPNYIFTYNG